MNITEKIQAAEKTQDETRLSVYLRTGEMYFSTIPTTVTTVLGSCVSITMFDKVLRVGAICHAFLPECEKQSNCHNNCQEKFRFVDCSVHHMIEQFMKNKRKTADIEIKLFGGSSIMSAKSGHACGMSTGNQNIQAAIKAIKLKGLRLDTYDIGGKLGRKIIFNSDTGEVFLKRVRKLTE